MKVLLRQLKRESEPASENLKATASCVLIDGDKWILIKGFCVWEKSGKLSISNPPKFGGHGNPFNQYISMSVSLKEKIHSLIETAYEKKKRERGFDFRQKIKTSWTPEEWKMTATPGRTKNKNTFSLKLILEDGADRIQFKGLGFSTGSRGLGFLKEGLITTARARFIFSPLIRFSLTIGALGMLVKP